ncbi:hypothetical protein Hanom_Chr11g01035271 [Helianthus anomalus]
MRQYLLIQNEREAPRTLAEKTQSKAGKKPNNKEARIVIYYTTDKMKEITNCNLLHN